MTKSAVAREVWLLRFGDALEPWLQRGRRYRLTRRLCEAAIAWFVLRNLRVLFHIGQVRHLEQLDAAFRAHGMEQLADRVVEAMGGDRATFVLLRDSDAWQR